MSHPLYGAPRTGLTERTIDTLSAHENPPHRHPQGQFVLVRQGLLQGFSSQSSWLLKAGMAIWIPPETVHWGETAHQVELLVVYATPEQCQAITCPLKLMNASCLIIGLCERLAAPNSALPDTRRERLLQLLFEEIADSPSSPLSLPLPDDPRLKKITDALIATPSLRHNLDSWGKHAGATARTLSRLFMRQTGLSFGAWHDRLLLSEAWRQLHAGYNNDALALHLGFSCGDAFGHWFKRIAGLTPGQARRQCQTARVLPSQTVRRDTSRLR
ncbi:AraC family transcriptional regulator [Musicola paradisiaca]|uniref:Transcriptional regulator, AraC family n=1 Tax=Musicola paradisiaca (strain Ech703) TaxID=579405 RepID=C6C927_MUSP7|nr:helix-turn-helix transcriptional regulator [Musicola paradisiaca]ACS86227.1 transcriptional regulator, AraC family [Musicola paradisiaca Ech703]